jgi:phosphoserine phosphatase
MSPAEFLDSVLKLRPAIAVFDCDGTLWATDAGERFMRWEISERLVPEDVGRWVQQRYADYLQGKVDEDTMCGEMVTINAGIPLRTLAEAAERFFAQHVDPHIFPVMRDLVARLRAQGAQLWAVSSSNEWVIQEGMRRFGIPADHVLAACVAPEDGRASNRLVRVPSGPGKARALREHVGDVIDVAFGNSIWDREMLLMSRSAFAVNPNPDLAKIARERGWPVFWPAERAEISPQTAEVSEQR